MLLQQLQCYSEMVERLIRVRELIDAPLKHSYGYLALVRRALERATGLL